ncbi:MAG: site-specific integrase [Ktedonobacteraceae bacterium]|nr:site-specific integrase [Ktedonobacteraceae bacterium]MBA3826129.1 site-specific integrase [Ktedonobacterales bacterium]
MATKKNGRRGNQEGTITHREDGRWEARMSLSNGKRKSFYGITKEEVTKKMRKAQQDVDAGLSIVSEKQTVGTYLKSWIEVKQHRIDASTLQRYEYYMRPIIEELGQVVLAKLTPYHIQHLHSSLLTKGWTTGTVGHAHGMFHAALKQAVRLGLVQRNVTDMVDPPKREEHEMKVLDGEQIRVLLNTVRDTWFEGVFYVVLSTGLRAGEVFALQWQDIDFAARRMQVRRGWQRTSKKTFLTLPKTSHGRRSIALSQTAIDALMRQQERLKQARVEVGDKWDTTHDLVFPGRTGKCYAYYAVSKKLLLPLLKRAGLPIVRFHDLRHTFATMLIGKGVNIKVVSEMLGHANIGITLSTYAHVLPHMQDSAAQVVDGVIGDVF